MDIGLLNQEGGWYNQEERTTEEWDRPENHWREHVNALNKGKGKGKNTTKGKGKGKSKGEETRTCYNCGKTGHLAANCP